MPENSKNSKIVPDAKTKTKQQRNNVCLLSFTQKHFYGQVDEHLAEDLSRKDTYILFSINFKEVTHVSYQNNRGQRSKKQLLGDATTTTSTINIV